VDKILVGLKRVVDYNVRVRVRSDGSGVETDGVKMSINPFDEIALEEALRIKERGDASEVIVVSIGGNDSQQQLRTGLAMGADRAILVDSGESGDPLTYARVFLALIERENPGLVILGKQAIDDDNSQTGQMLAALWDRPQATFASKLEVNGDKATVTREVDVGPLDMIEIAELNIEQAPAIKEVNFEPPSDREKGVLVNDVAGLVAALKDKGLI
jgi:electron transfer flavoprotein beta subunit